MITDVLLENAHIGYFFSYFGGANFEFFCDDYCDHTHACSHVPEIIKGRPNYLTSNSLLVASVYDQSEILDNYADEWLPLGHKQLDSAICEILSVFR